MIIAKIAETKTNSRVAGSLSPIKSENDFLQTNINFWTCKKTLFMKSTVEKYTSIDISMTTVVAFHGESGEIQ